LADYALVLARTDPHARRSQGLSVFLVDLGSPGVTRTPILDLIGEPTYAEIIFEGVRVPSHHLIGRQGDGLRHLIDALEWDRLWARGVKAPFLRQELQDLIRYAQRTARDSTTLWRDPVVRDRLMDLSTQIEVCDSLFANALDSFERKRANAFAEVSIAKMFADDLGQRFYSDAELLLGPDAALTGEDAPLEGRIPLLSLAAHGLVIAGGTAEVQRNTVAIRGLGLPRD
jgi:alkylation response protein AidB-like acyl-CoA dehydrogenase